MFSNRAQSQKEHKKKTFLHRKKLNLISFILTIAIVVTSLGFLGSVFDNSGGGSGGSSSSNNSNTGTNNGSNSNDNNSDDNSSVIRVYDCFLVSDPSTLSPGDKVIITNKNFKYALSYGEDGFSSMTPNATVINDRILFAIDPQILVLEVGIYENSYAFNLNIEYMACLSADSLSLGVESIISERSSWDINIVDGAADVCLSANKLIKLRFGSDNTFKLYDSDAGLNSSNDICIIKIESISTT